MFSNTSLKLGALAKEAPSKSTLGILHRAVDLGPDDYNKISKQLADRMHRWHAAGGNIDANMLMEESAYAAARFEVLKRGADCSDEIFKTIFENLDASARQQFLHKLGAPAGLIISPSDPLKVLRVATDIAETLSPENAKKLFAALAPVVQKHKDKPLPENAGKWLIEEAALDARQHENFLCKAEDALKGTRPQIMRNFMARRETLRQRWNEFTNAAEGRADKAHGALEACADMLEIEGLERFISVAGTDAQHEISTTRSLLAAVESSRSFDEAFSLYAAKGDLTTLFDAVSQIVSAEQTAAHKPSLVSLAGHLRTSARARFAEMFLDGEDRILYTMPDDEDFEIPPFTKTANGDFEDAAPASL